MTILVTGVGGGAGQSILKSLDLANIKDVIAVDSSPLAAGLYFGSRSFLGYEAHHPLFIHKLLEICQSNQVDFVFPGHDVELPFLSSKIELFESKGIKLIVSDERVVDICDDKLETSNFLKDNGFFYPETKLLEEFNWEGKPVILKPRTGGARSRQTYLVKTLTELETYTKLVNKNNCVVQEYIEGDEYTCGSVFLRDRDFGNILMKRELRSGDTYKAFSIKSESLSRYISNVVGALAPFGACNFQLKMRGDIPYIFEVNARCSGTTAARALVGFNEPKIIIDFLRNGIKFESDYKEMTILRFWQEILVENESLSKIAGLLD
jgi:carbamoyl-phosphate synthase large subunit